MRIRLLASPPLFVAAGEAEYAVECYCRDGVGVIVAKPKSGTETTISLGHVDHGGDDVRLAWREGFDVASTDEAQHLAVALVKSGLADEIHARVELRPMAHQDNRGTPV